MIALWAILVAVALWAYTSDSLWVYVLYLLFFAVYGVMLSVARLHDAGKSGWFLLVALIPLGGWQQWLGIYDNLC